MLKEKSQWEKRIIELGGPDFRVFYFVFIHFSEI